MPLSSSSSTYVDGARPARQLRSRPIDLHKKLQILRTVEDIQKLDEEHGLRVDPSTIFRWDVPKDDEQELQLKMKKNIATPEVQTRKKNMPILRKFELPDYYLRYEAKKDNATGIYLDDGSIVHFEMLQEDQLFLDDLQRKAGKQMLSETNFIKMIDRFEKASGRRNDGEGEISFNEALKIKKDLRIELPSYFVKEVHNHWKTRCSALGRSLLRMFWPQTSVNDVTPFAVFRPRTKDKMILRRPKRNQAEIVHKLERLLDDFKKVEKIFKKMKQRDEKKLLLMEINQLLFDQMRHELYDPDYKLPHWNHIKELKFDKAAKKMKKEKDRLESLHRMGTFYCSPYPEKKMNRHLRRLSPIADAAAERDGSLPMTGVPYAPPPYGKRIYGAAFDEGGHQELSAPSVQLRVMRRRGRGGRIWLDRKHVQLTRAALPTPHKSDVDTESHEWVDYNQTEGYDHSCPTIGSNLDSFDLVEMSNYLNKQRTLMAIVDSFAPAEDTLSLKRRLMGFNNSPQEAIDKNSREAYEARHSFRTWIKYALPLPPSHHDTRLNNWTSGNGREAPYASAADVPNGYPVNEHSSPSITHVSTGTTHVNTPAFNAVASQ